jgi:hypothetical protein
MPSACVHNIERRANNEIICSSADCTARDDLPFGPLARRQQLTSMAGPVYVLFAPRERDLYPEPQEYLRASAARYTFSKANPGLVSYRVCARR